MSGYLPDTLRLLLPHAIIKSMRSRNDIHPLLNILLSILDHFPWVHSACTNILLQGAIWNEGHKTINLKDQGFGKDLAPILESVSLKIKMHFISIRGKRN